MSPSFKKTDRVAEQLQRKLAQIVQREIQDPRLPGALITISGFRMATDLSHAKVFFTIFNGDRKIALEVLNGASPHLRTLLARHSHLRTIPELHFVYDESLEYGQSLSRLIDKANPTENE